MLYGQENTNFFNLSFDGGGEGVDSIHLFKDFFSDPKLHIFRVV